MKPPLPLIQIKLFDWKSHGPALWWLGVLYRRPQFLEESLAAEGRWVAVRQGIKLYLHCLPYLAAVSILLRALLLLLTHAQWTWSSLFSDAGVGIVFGIAGGIVFGIAGGIAFRIAGGIALGTAGGIALGIAFGIALGIALGIARGIDSGFSFGIAVGLVGGLTVGLAGGIAFGIGFGIGVGITFGIAAGVATWIALLRAFYLLVHPLFVWPKARGRIYNCHPVAWDDLCAIPFPALDRLLVAFTELEPLAGAAEVERIINSYPSQRTQALRARVILLARESKQLSDLVGLREIARRLPQGETALLRQSREIAEALGEISTSQIRLNTIDRPALRAPHAQLLVKEIESFHHKIAGFKPPLATEFRAAALEWAKIAQRQLDEARSILGREPISQVFRAGDPVKREQEAFVYRDSVAGRLDQQVTLSSGCPGIVLYARRRMGKTTFLTNLEGFLPPSVTIRMFSMQDASVFTSIGHFVERITEGRSSDLPGFADYLSKEDQRLRSEGGRLLLMMDEYEGIDQKIGAGVFPKDLLAAIRESIQKHRQITWLFAGSHEIAELRNAEWSSYLISARTIEIPFFSLDETRLLLTDPLKHSPLFQESGDRPRFALDLWGANGVERIHAESGGWPHLVQLIAETVVDLLNQQGKSSLTTQLMERSLDEAVTAGDVVLFQLMRGECTLPGEWEYLSAFRKAHEQNPPDDETVLQSPKRRKLIQESAGRWHLRVSLMERWLRLRR